MKYIYLFCSQRIEYTPELEKIIENLHSTLGSSLGLPQSGNINQSKIYIYIHNSLSLLLITNN